MLESLVSTEKKYADPLWDFRSADTKRHTHCFHNYPAMMIPQIAGALLDKYGAGAKLLFDPYCGSGTSLVEASLRGIDSVGTDINPLARLMSSAKTSFLPIDELDGLITEFGDMIFCLGFSCEKDLKPTLPNFRNIDFWFSPIVKMKLAHVLQFIGTIEDIGIQSFFKVCFSETIRKASWTRNGEFKLYRITEKQREIFDPDVFKIMVANLYRARNGLKSYMYDAKGRTAAKVFGFNTVEGIPDNVLQRESVDIIVTSPPYGDSRTTVAYGQYSRLSLEWLGFEDAGKIDSMLMGGKKPNNSEKFKTYYLSEIVSTLSSKDPKRTEDVISFYKDYEASISHVAPLLKKGGISCYVVGNRKVKGLVLPTDEITVELFKTRGFSHLETIIRNIPNKRMPSRNSPSNVTGELEDTMTQEFIVVMRKD